MRTRTEYDYAQAMLESINGTGNHDEHEEIAILTGRSCFDFLTDTEAMRPIVNHRQAMIELHKIRQLLTQILETQNGFSD